MALPQARSISEEQVPIVDLAAMHGGSAEERARLVERLGDVCRTVGFFYVINHGLPERELQEPFEMAQRFFALPEEEKLQISLARNDHFRGYLPMKRKGNDPALRGNIHEAFHYYLERDADHPDITQGLPLRGPNQWPQAIPGFRDAMLRYYERIDRLAFAMLPLFETALGLPEGKLAGYFTDPMTMVRLLHYPPQLPHESGEHIGVRPHTDNGAFTILSQDDKGGLEILRRDGEWIAVPPIRNSLVINIGEMLKLWSDGEFLSTPHRVVNRSGLERYSIPYFLQPDYDVKIVPLITNSGEVNEPLMHNSLKRGDEITCGEIFENVWNRIWPRLNERPTVVPRT